MSEEEILELDIEEKPYPGTNKDVFLYPNTGLVGTYYPEEDETLFDSGFIFNDISDAQARSKRIIQNSLDDNSIYLKFRSNETRTEFEQSYGGEVIRLPFSYMYEIDLMMKIITSWMRYIPKMGSSYKPNKKILNQEGYDILDRLWKWWVEGSAGGYSDLVSYKNIGGNVETIHGSKKYVGGEVHIPENPNQQWAALSPLFHFPPDCSVFGFGDILFYDNSDKESSYNKLITMYGIDLGKKIFDECSKMNRDVSYNDLIKKSDGHGYGFKINWSHITGDTSWNFVIPFDKYLLTYDDIINYHADLVQSSPNSRVRILYDMPGILRNPYNFSLRTWSQRDKLVMYWLNGGMIPFQNNSWDKLWHGFPGYPMLKIAEFKPHLGDIYPIWWEKTEAGFSYWGFVLKIIAALVAAILSIVTGGTLLVGIATAAAAILMAIFEAVMAKIATWIGPEYSDIVMLTSGILGGVLNKYVLYPTTDTAGKPDPSQEKYQKAIGFFAKSGIQEIMNLNIEGRENLKNMIFNFDMQASHRQKVAMEMMLRHKDERIGHFLDSTEPTGVSGIELQSEEIKQMLLGRSGIEVTREQLLLIRDIESTTKDKQIRKTLTNMALSSLGTYSLVKILQRMKS
jgi:hypothetical protein